MSVLIRQSGLPDWDVTFFIDAGDLDWISEVVERGSGRRYRVAQSRDIFPSDLLQDRATPEFPDPLEALEKKIKALPTLDKVDGFN